MHAVMRAGSNNEFSDQITDKMLESMLRGVRDIYYNETAAGAEVIFDTNRTWAAQMPLALRLAPEAKMIACVRNPAWVMDSVEKITRKNPLKRSGLFGNDAERATVYTRADALTRYDRLIGSAWTSLKQAYYSDEADRLLLVEYDILCQRPRDTMQLIYQFLDEPWFEHDFDNVDYTAESFDERLNTPGLHTVGRRVEFKPRRSILPPDIFERLNQMVFWNDLHKTKAHKIVTQSEAPVGRA